MSNINPAVSAYTQALKQLSGGGAAEAAPVQGVSGVQGVSFGDVLKESLGSAMDAQHKSEQVSAKALVGQADMTEVLQAVNNAEMALTTVLAIRDKVVQAYDQILHTPV